MDPSGLPSQPRSPRSSCVHVLLAAHLGVTQGPSVPRKQEELVQQVRKRLEEALMADMLAHVEELARDGEAPLDKACTEDDDEEDEEEEEEEPDPDPEMEHV